MYFDNLLRLQWLESSWSHACQIKQTFLFFSVFLRRLGFLKKTVHFLPQVLQIYTCWLFLSLSKCFKKSSLVTSAPDMKLFSCFPELLYEKHCLFRWKTPWLWLVALWLIRCYLITAAAVCWQVFCWSSGLWYHFTLAVLYSVLF